MNFICLRHMSAKQSVSFIVISIFFAACTGAFLLPVLPAHAQASSGQTVLIGFAGGLGKKTQSNLSYSARDGAQMAVDDANQRKLQIGGRPVFFKLLVADDQSDVNFARVTAKSFVASGVAGVIGHNTTDTSVAAAPIYADAGIPQLSPTSTGRQFTQGGYRTAFQLLGHSDITSILLAKVSLDMLKAKRVAVIDNGTALGAALAEVFLRQVKQDGGLVVLRDTVNSKTSDFNGVLSRVKSEGADLLLFTGVGPQAVAFSQHCQRLGVNSTLLLSGGAVNLEFPDSGPYPEGTHLLLHGLPVESRPGYAQFEKAYSKKFDSPLTAYAMFSYDAVGMLIEALRKNNSVDPKAAVETLHNMQYKGISGTVSFAVDGSQNNPPYTLYRISQRKWQVVRTFGG